MKPIGNIVCKTHSSCTSFLLDLQENTYKEIKVITYPTSTVIEGEYEYAMNALKETIAETNKKYGMAVYVTKIIPNYKAL